MGHAEEQGLVQQFVAHVAVEALDVAILHRLARRDVIYRMADDRAFLILEPPDRFATPYKDFADRMGMRYANLVRDPASDGFSVDLDDLDRLLDRPA